VQVDIPVRAYTQTYVPVVMPLLDVGLAPRLQRFIFIGTMGKIRGYEITNHAGHPQTVWTDELKGMGYHMVHTYLHAPSGRLFAITNGNLLCFDALTGKRIWQAKSPNQHGLFESDLMTLWSDGAILVSACNSSILVVHAATGAYVWEAMLNQVIGRTGAFTVVEFRGLLIIGNDGYVFAFDKITGRSVWRNGLKGKGFRPVSLAAYTYTQHGSYARDTLFVGTIGYVLNVDPISGRTRQEINLDGTGYNPVAFLVDPTSDTLYCATNGELRCLRAESGKAAWRSNLPGMGYSYGHSLLFSDNHIIVGMNGKVCAVDRASGTEVWKTSLPGCGFMFVTVGVMTDPHQLICASNGHLYGLDHRTGRVIWQDGMAGLGYSHSTVSTGIFNTDFNSATLPQYIEVQRRENNRNNTY